MRFFDPIRRAYSRLGLGATALIALAFGALTLGASLLVAGGVSEDVTQHNGQALQDASRLRFFTDHRSDLLIRASKALTDIGTPLVLAPLALVAGWFLWHRGLRLAIALAPPLALGVAGVGVAVVKGVVDRARPPTALHLVSESDASFPSGHATDSAALFLTVALVVAVYVLRRPIARALSVACAGAVAGAIGTSRLVLGVHWPTDVLAGWALGISVALAVTMTATLVERAAPPAGGVEGNPLRRVSHRALRVLTVARNPRRELRAI